jgi:hypothetical protein
MQDGYEACEIEALSPGASPAGFGASTQRYPAVASSGSISRLLIRSRLISIRD